MQVWLQNAFSRKKMVFKEEDEITEEETKILLFFRSFAKQKIIVQGLLTLERRLRAAYIRPTQKKGLLFSSQYSCER